MTASYEILKYRPEFRDGVVRLQTHLLWSRDVVRNEAYLSWKHEQNPYQSEPCLYLAMSGRDVVGMRSFFQTEWQVGTPPETFRALYADDFVIAPEHRNRGVARRIMTIAFEELREGPHAYAVNLSAGGVTFLTSLAAGWKSAGPMQPVARRSRGGTALHRLRARMGPRRFFRGRLGSVIGLATGSHHPFSRLDRLILEGAGRAGPHVIVEAAPRCEAMAALVAQLPFDGRIRHSRDERFLSWRYRNPLREYRFLYWGPEPLEGYLVLQSPRENRQWPARVRIVDWEARDDRVRAGLLQAAICGGFAELVMWTATQTPGVRQILQEAGFEPVDADRTARGIPGLLLKPLHPGPPDADWVFAGRRLLDLSQWDLRMIYSMHG
jgi:GNAT superfamily N-acetyltransferase